MLVRVRVEVEKTTLSDLIFFCWGEKAPRGRLGGRPETVMCKICAVLCARAFPAQAGSRRPPLGRKEGCLILPISEAEILKLCAKLCAIVMCPGYVPKLFANELCLYDAYMTFFAMNCGIHPLNLMQR